MEWDSSIPNYFKAIKIIESCRTLGQLKTAEKYVMLFKEQYDIDESYSEFLDRSLFSKKMKLKNGWNNKN
jgi:hypothetical protein